MQIKIVGVTCHSRKLSSKDWPKERDATAAVFRRMLDLVAR